MPTYYAAGITASLIATDLAASTAPGVSKRKDDIMRRALDAATASLEAGRTMEEDAINLNEHGPVHFLADRPFIMVKAGHNLFSGLSLSRSASRRGHQTSLPVHHSSIPNGFQAASPQPVSLHLRSHNHHSGGYEATSTNSSPFGSLADPHDSFSHVNHHTRCAEPIPHALAIRIRIKKTVFLTVLNDDKTPQDLKFDVYFNGNLTESSMLHARENKMATKSQIFFSGRRMAYSYERPWVIIPAGQHANGSLRGQKRRKQSDTSSAQNRWELIGSELMAAANALGRNEEHQRPPIGRYLEALSQVKMPDEVARLYKPSGAQYGIIDVVVSIGVGNKKTGSTPYISQPTPFEDKRYKVLGQISRSLGVEGTPKHECTLQKRDSSLPQDTTSNTAQVSPRNPSCSLGEPMQSLLETPALHSSPSQASSGVRYIGATVGQSPSAKRRRTSRADDFVSGYPYQTPGDMNQGISRRGVFVTASSPTAIRSPHAPIVDKNRFEIFETPPSLGIPGGDLPGTPITRVVVASDSEVIRDTRFTSARWLTNRPLLSSSKQSRTQSPPKIGMESCVGFTADWNHGATHITRDEPLDPVKMHTESLFTSMTNDDAPVMGTSGTKPDHIVSNTSKMKGSDTSGRLEKGYISSSSALVATKAGIEQDEDDTGSEREAQSSGPPPPKAGHILKRTGRSAYVIQSEPTMAVPELSQNCVITYAEPRAGEEMALGPRGVVRQVRWQRPGRFEEVDVVVGFRFVVMTS